MRTDVFFSFHFFFFAIYFVNPCFRELLAYRGCQRQVSGTPHLSRMDKFQEWHPVQVFTSTSSNTVGGVRNNGEGKLEDHVIISRGTIETSLLIATRYVLIGVYG